MLQAEISREFPHLELSNAKSWAQLTTLGIGTAHPTVAVPADAGEFAALLQSAKRKNCPLLLLGGGSNLVGSDRELDLLVVRLSSRYFGDCRIEGERLVAGAAVRPAALAKCAAEAGLGGLAELAGIPGQLGGMVRMNAGANGVEIGRYVHRISGIDGDGNPFECYGDDIDWSYRGSNLPEGVAILSVELELPRADRAEELAKIEAELERRRQFEDGGRSAGCVFRNVGANEPAGKLIDAAGLKGACEGGISVSPHHANYLIHSGGGSALDFAQLAARVRVAVQRKFGFTLRYEVRFVDPDIEKIAQAGARHYRVALFQGGDSSEREISFKSAAAIGKALRNGGFEVIDYDITECALPEWLTPELAHDPDFIVYPGLHGGFGEDGRLQALLEANGIGFVGSDSASSRLVMDKLETKALALKIGIPTAKWGFITAEASALPAGLRLPVVLKVPNEGSTVGIAMAADETEYAEKAAELLRLAPKILVEEFIEGTEITVPVIGGTAYPVIEIRSPHGFYDYDAKYVYKHGHTSYFCPPETVQVPVQVLAQRYSEQFFAAAGCRDLLRVDFIVDRDGVPQLLEGNSLPGCTETSLVPKAARVAELSFERLTAQLALAAFERHRRGVVR